MRFFFAQNIGSPYVECVCFHRDMVLSAASWLNEGCTRLGVGGSAVN